MASIVMQIMNETEITEIAKAWVAVELIRKNESLTDEDFWAQTKLLDLTFDDPINAIKIIIQISKLSSDPTLLSHLGAGPIEELMCQHGQKVIKIIEDEARNNQNFKKALAVVQIEKQDTTAYEKFYEIAEVEPY